MVPRALEQYVTQLAEKGPGSLAANMPKVSSPKVLREASEERLVSNRASNRYGHFSVMYYFLLFRTRTQSLMRYRSYVFSSFRLEIGANFHRFFLLSKM